MGSGPSIPTPPTPPSPPPEKEEPAEFEADATDKKKQERVTATNLRVNVNAPGAGTNVPGS